MKITILCSEAKHPIQQHLRAFAARHSAENQVTLIRESAEAEGGDLLFLISCHELIPKGVRDRYRKTLVVHASDLPAGRGWSPHVWSILAGAKQIVVTLLEAHDGVDSGKIWRKTSFNLEGHELYDEINSKLFAAEMELLDFAIASSDQVEPIVQDHSAATYYRRRLPEDSRLDPDQTLREQFDLMRVCDPARFPCFLELHGEVYEVVLRKRARR